MTYHTDPASIRALVQPDRVHRDVYTDPDVFAAEMEHLWANTWVFVGHDSQVPAEGDYFTTTVGLQAGDDGAPARRQRAGDAQPLAPTRAPSWCRTGRATWGRSSAVHTTPGPTGWTARCGACR